jgi:ABC-type transport system involved in cytochrome bd biosynthesis fused ATPase/permease subunit
MKIKLKLHHHKLLACLSVLMLGIGIIIMWFNFKTGAILIVISTIILFMIGGGIIDSK